MSFVDKVSDKARDKDGGTRSPFDYAQGGLFTLLTLFLLAALAPRAEAGPQQMKITFGGYTNRSEVLTNFPVLVVLSNNVGSGFTFADFATTNGYDLRFATNSTLTTDSLNYEIESWNINGASYVWVQVPTIPTNGSGAIWANWGNTSASNQLACTTNGAVWTNGYQAVWHMQSTNATDSSTNRYNATPVGGVTQTSGRVGPAVAFNGTSGYLQVATNDTFKGSDDVTIEFWVNPAAAAQVAYAEIMDYNHDTSPYKNWVVQLYSTPRDWSWAVNNAVNDSWGPWDAIRKFTPAASVWTHVTLVKSGLTFIYYTNGGQLSSAANFATAAIDKEPRILRIGAHASALDRFLNGSLDEIRIANVAKSADWIWACYQNQASPTTFNNYGAMTAQDPNSPAIRNDAVTSVATNSAMFNGTLTSTGSSACAVCVLWGEQNGGKTWNWAKTNWFNGGAVNDAWTNNTPFSTNITLTESKTYYYTYAATNAATNAVASGPQSFVTGLVTVEATTNTARYFPRTNGLYTIFRPLGCTNEAMTVYYTMSGTATNGVHYDSLPLTAQFNAGATSTVVNLAPKSGGVGTAILTLSGGYSYPTGAQNSATVTIDPSAISPYVYVVQSGSSPAVPYDSWATAANSIQTAVDYAAANFGNGVNTVIVSNGTYNISADIAVGQAITICSFGNGVTGGLANAASTILSRGNGRYNFNITAAATVDGFTARDCNIRNGVSGGNVMMTHPGAMLKNCILRDNYGGYSGRDPAGYMVSGVVSNCLIYGNSTGERLHEQGAFRIDGGLMVGCKIYNNSIGTSECSGGGVWLNGSSATLRNCLLYGNYTSGNGGGVYLSNGTVENCTIYGNTAGGSGGGIYRAGGIVRNCIVYNNTAGDANKNIVNADANVTYTCTTNPVSTGASCISADPLFVNPVQANYTLQTTSPCIDGGANQAWMTGATDLAGNTRKTYGGVAGSRGSPVVDMGAYEAPEAPPKGTVFMMR